MAAVSITPIFTHRWHRKRHDPTKVIGCFEVPFVPAAPTDDETAPPPPCSVTIVDEGRKTFGCSYLVPGSKQLPLTKAFSNVLFAACSEQGCLSIAIVLRKKSLGLLVATHASTYPHAVIAVKDVSKAFGECCHGVAAKAYELGVRRACVHATPCGVLVVVVLANAAGTTFLVRGNVDTGRWSRQELEPLQGSMPHLSIDVANDDIRVVLGRADVGVPTGTTTTVDGGSSAEREDPLALFAVESPLSRHNPNAAVSTSHIRGPPSVRSVQLRWDVIGWGEHSFSTTRLESGAFAPPEGSFALLSPHGQACPLHVGPTVATVLLPMANDTVAVQLPTWEACCGRPVVHSHWVTIPQLRAPMSITRVRTRNNTDDGILLILAEDCSLFAVEILGDAIPVSVATASLDPSLPLNRLTFGNDMSVQHPAATGAAAHRLSSRVSIHPLAPEAILVSNGLTGSILRCAITDAAAVDSTHAVATYRSLRKGSIAPRCSLVALQRQAASWLRAHCADHTPLTMCHAVRALLPSLSSMTAHLPLHDSVALLSSVADAAVGLVHVASLDDWIVAWAMLGWLRNKANYVVARCSPAALHGRLGLGGGGAGSVAAASEQCTVRLLACLDALNAAHTLQGLNVSEAALSLVRPTLSAPMQVLLSPKRPTLDDHPVASGLVEAILRDGGVTVATAEAFALQLVGTAQLTTGSWTIHTPNGCADVLQCLGVSLLCSCLDVALCIDVTPQHGVRFHLSQRSPTALRVMPVVFTSQTDYDHALALSADLLCTRGNVESLTPYPLDLLLLSLLCCGRTHAVKTAFQLFPVQWDSIFRQMLTMLDDEDDAKRLFADCLTSVDVDASALLTYALQARPAVDTLHALTQRTAVVLANFASANKGEPFAELRCLAEHLPVDIVQFIAAVALHNEVEALVVAAQQHAADVVKTFLPPKGRATSPAMLAHAAECAKEARDAAHATCAASVRRLCVVLPQVRDVLAHKMLHPEARGRSLSLLQRTLERDARVVCLLKFQATVEDVLAAQSKAAHQPHAPPSTSTTAAPNTHPAVLYVCTALQSYVALTSTLLPVEHVQQHCLDAVGLCLTQLLPGSGDAAASNSAAALAAFLKEVLTRTEVARSDILSIKRAACHLEDAILAVLHACPNEAAAVPNVQQREILKQAALSPTMDERKKVQRYAGVGWQHEALRDGRYAFLINDAWLESLWPVEFFANDWFPVVERILPPPTMAASEAPAASHDAAVELSAQCRKALLATVCAIAPPLRSFQSSTVTTTRPTATAATGTSTTPTDTPAAPQPTAVGTEGAASKASVAANAKATTTQVATTQPPSAATSRPIPQLLSLDPVAMSGGGMSIALSTATDTSVAGSPPVVMSTDKQTGPHAQPQPQQPQLREDGVGTTVVRNTAGVAPDATESVTYTAADIAWWDADVPPAATRRPEDVVLSFPVASGGDGAAADDSDTSYTNATTMTSANNPRRRDTGHSSRSSSSSSSRRKHHRHGRHHHRDHRRSHRPHLCAKHAALCMRKQTPPLPQQPAAQRAPTRTEQHAVAAHQPCGQQPAALQAPPQPVVTQQALRGVAAPAASPSHPAPLQVPTTLTLPSVTAPCVRLVDPAVLQNQGRSSSEGGALAGPVGQLRPPPAVTATQDRSLSAPLQPPPAPSTVFFNNGHAPPSLPFQYAGGMGFPMGLAPPQLLVNPKHAKKPHHKRHHKHHKKRSSSSSSSSSSGGDAKDGKKTKSDQKKGAPANQGKTSQKIDTMQFEDLNRLYSFLMDEVPLPPGEIMYRGADNAMKLATAPLPLQASAVLPPSEQARFQHYVDDLLLKNRQQQPLAPSDTQQGPPPGSPLRGNAQVGKPSVSSSSAINRSASHEEFLQQLAAQQHAMFQAQQEMFAQQQRENASLVRRLSEQQPGAGTAGGTSYANRSGASSPLRTSHGAASSPTRPHGEVGASGLTAMQQAQLVEETMEYRRRVLQLSEELVKLQSRVMAQQQQPPKSHAGSTPPTPLTNLRHEAVNTSAHYGAAHSVSGGSPLRPESHHSFRSVAVGGGNNYQTQSTAAQTHGLRAATPPRPSSAAANTSQQQLPPNQSLLVSRSALYDMQNELRRLTEGTNRVEQATADAVGLLQRSSMHHSASEFAMEQQAAIEALRRKAASVQSQLLLSEQQATGGASYGSGRLGTGQHQALDDHGAMDMVRMTSTLMEPQLSAGGQGRQWVSESEGGYQPQQPQPHQTHTTDGAAEGRMWSTVSEGVLPATDATDAYPAAHHYPSTGAPVVPNRGHVFEDVAVSAAELHNSPRRPMSTRDGHSVAASFAAPSSTVLQAPSVQPHQHATSASAHQPSSPKRGTSSAKSPTREASRRVGAWEPLVPAHGEAGSMHLSTRVAPLSGGNLGSLFEAAKGGTAGVANTNTSASRVQHQQPPAPPHERSTSAKRSQSKEKNATPDNLKMYATGHPTKKATEHKHYHQRASSASPAKGSSGTAAVRDATPSAPTADKRSSNVLKGKRTLDIGDKFSEKQRRLLEEHTKARIAAVKRALS